MLYSHQCEAHLHLLKTFRWSLSFWFFVLFFFFFPFETGFHAAQASLKFTVLGKGLEDGLVLPLSQALRLQAGFHTYPTFKSMQSSRNVLPTARALTITLEIT